MCRKTILPKNVMMAATHGEAITAEPQMAKVWPAKKA